MIDPSHKAVVVFFQPYEKRKIVDVCVCVGPNFSMGEGDVGGYGVRLLMTEVKTSSIELTDHAIYKALRENEWALKNEDDTHTSAAAWLAGYEENQVLQKKLEPSDCIAWGRF